MIMTNLYIFLVNYLFDFGDNWVFQVTNTRHKDKTPKFEAIYPRVIETREKIWNNIQIGNMRKNR